MSALIEQRLTLLEEDSALHSQGYEIVAKHIADLGAANLGLGAVLLALLAGQSAEERARIRVVATATVAAVGGNEAAAGLINMLTSDPAEPAMALIGLPAIMQ